MKKLRFFSLMTLILMLTHLLAPAAAAHPLGNFTINHYAGLHVTRQAVTVDYVLDMAEIPAFQEIGTFDANGNGQPDPAETERYHPAQCAAIAAGLDLRRNDQSLPLTIEASALEFPAGAGGLPTLRLTCAFRSPLPEMAESVQITFENNAYTERLGWREIVISSDGVSLDGDLASLSSSLSQRLTAYPDDLLTNPLNQRRASFSLNPLDSSPQPSNLPTFEPKAPYGQPSNLPTSNPAPDRNDGFTRLINAENLSPLTLLLTLAVAFSWGAAHALTPGHGKTIVAAYLVGSRGTMRHALFLGLTTTVTHTAGVFLLGFLTLFASKFILPEQLYPWLGVASGLLVVGMGWSLFRGRLRQLTGRAGHSHDHDHPHSHDHDHVHEHSHSHGGHTHSHLPPGSEGIPVTWRSLLALGVSGGLIPCPSALVVMLSAIALQRIGFGLLLIVAFSLGLAGVLTAIGIVWVHAGRFFNRMPASGPLLRVVPVLSALFITVVGLGIVLQALVQTGLLPSEMSTALTLAAARASALF